MPPESLTLVERYGSFGALVVLLVWVAAWLVPRTIQAFRDLVAGFVAELKAERDARETQHKACEETHQKTAAAIEANTQSVSDLAAIVKDITECEECRKSSRKR